MKNKLFIIVFIGLSLIFTKANTQTIKHTAPVISYIVPENPSACLDNYLALCDNIAAITLTGLYSCVQNFPNDPDGHIECNSYYMDMEFNMHGVAEAMYDRCRANQP